jgi:hypothetical protein
MHDPEHIADARVNHCGSFAGSLPARMNPLRTVTARRGSVLVGNAVNTAC